MCVSSSIRRGHLNWSNNLKLNNLNRWLLSFLKQNPEFSELETRKGYRKTQLFVVEISKETVSDKGNFEPDYIQLG